MEYLSISQFAKLAGIPKQEAYKLWESEKQANKDTVKYDGIKLISSSLLDIYIKPQAEENKDIPKEKEKEEQQDASLIKFLIHEVEKRDEQIKELEKQLAKLGEKEQELTEKALQIASQAQVLQLEQQTHKRRGIFGLLFNRNKNE